MKLNFKAIFRLKKLLLFPGIVLFTQCNSDKKSNLAEAEDRNPDIVYLELNDTVTHQTIAHFGASDAWSCQFVGKWPEEKKSRIAELLFSRDLDENGDPKGIGLSLWRFNIGAGSAEQGVKSGIQDEWRRAESFLTLNNTYNWNNMQGQVWFAKQARASGVENLLVFANSPHVNFTRNGKAYVDTGSQSNLNTENRQTFATYLAEVLEGMQKMGLTVNYLSPVNEPQWDWSEGRQEGTPFWNDEIAQITRLIDAELENRDLDVKIDVAEAAQLNYMFEEGDKPGRSMQIKDFFNAGSPNYIGDLSHMGHAISGHSYFSTSPYNTLVGQRKKLAENITGQNGLDFWMSEYCILGDNDGEIDGAGRDLGIDPALYVARVIHTDLTVANAAAWHWWLAVSPYDYKDGLIYIDKNKTDGNFHESKILWTFGNYSRFIRPGFVRIEIKQEDPDNLLVSGYVNPENGKLVIVAVNSGQQDLKVNFSSEGQLVKPDRSYVTSSEHNLEKTDLRKDGHLEIPNRSIVTFIYE